MSNICYEETNFAIYGIILQKAINRVLSKIGLSDEGITWVIFNEKPCMKMVYYTHLLFYQIVIGTAIVMLIKR